MKAEEKITVELHVPLTPGALEFLMRRAAEAGLDLDGYVSELAATWAQKERARAA